VVKKIGGGTVDTGKKKNNDNNNRRICIRILYGVILMRRKAVTILREHYFI